MTRGHSGHSDATACPISNSAGVCCHADFAGAAPDRAAGTVPARSLDRQPGHPFGQQLQRGLGLKAGERLAETVVKAAGEGEVRSRSLTVYVEGVRVRVDLRIPVGRPEQRDYHLVLFYSFTFEFKWLQRMPDDQLDRRIEPQR